MEIASQDIIEFCNVSFSYGEIKVLEDVNLAVKEEDFIAIVGPNGSAKSTLLKLMIGELRPKSGSITILGHKVEQFSDWSKIGYLSQQVGNINTSFPATVEEVVSSGYYSGFGRIFDNSRQKEAVKKALQIVEMNKFSRRLIGELSGGQRQKVFLAKALVKSPKVLFLDEPTTGVDIQFQEEFYELLTNLNEKEHMTIVMVTHDMDGTLRRAKSIGYIKERRVYIKQKTRDLTKADLTKALGFV